MDEGDSARRIVGRIVGDFLIHYFNLAGAYIVCATVLAVALYMATGVFVLGDPTLGADTLCFYRRTERALQGLAGRAGERARAEKIWRSAERLPNLSSRRAWS